ncbi:hypothetical protein [Staphylococcus simulans]|uniref:hypothetical protein n=1 Tax=Staphylococcus simulans TaxID=1286 RepID=UPI003132DF41
MIFCSVAVASVVVSVVGALVSVVDGASAFGAVVSVDCWVESADACSPATV